jgi:hypothetical protein
MGYRFCVEHGKVGKTKVDGIIRSALVPVLDVTVLRPDLTPPLNGDIPFAVQWHRLEAIRVRVQSLSSSLAARAPDNFSVQTKTPSFVPQ